MALVLLRFKVIVILMGCLMIPIFIKLTLKLDTSDIGNQTFVAEFNDTGSNPLAAQSEETQVLEIIVTNTLDQVIDVSNLSTKDFVKELVFDDNSIM